MKKTRIHSFYDFRAYDGIDIDIETSLREYGIAWKKINNNEYKFIFGNAISEDEFGNPIYTGFDYSFITRADYDSMLNETWFHRENVESYADCNMDEYSPFNIYNAISYHGAESILGSSYYTFKIGKI